MTTNIIGGIDIAMKLPSHQYEETITFYCDVVCLKDIPEKVRAVGFKLFPNQLWIDEVPTMMQVEV